MKVSSKGGNSDGEDDELVSTAERTILLDIKVIIEDHDGK